MGVCNQINLLILYYINSRMKTILKVTDALVQVSDIFYLTLSFKFINFRFQILLLLFLKCLLPSHLILFRLSTSLWFGSCNHCILACFLWPKKCKHSSSNQGLSWIHSYRPRLSLAEVFIISLMFQQTLFMSSVSFKFSKAANLFEILIWYCFLTSSSLSLLKLNCSTSNFWASWLLTANLTLTFTMTSRRSIS